MLLHYQLTVNWISLPVTTDHFWWYSLVQGPISFLGISLLSICTWMRWFHETMGSSIWRPHTPYGRFWNSNQNKKINSFQIQTKFNSLYGKKLRKILESKPKSTVALRIVINPAGMALDIKIFHGIQLELNTGQAIFSC